VNVAFADSVDEAAAYARFFGDIAEERDVTQGAIWGQREWLDSVISEVSGLQRIFRSQRTHPCCCSMRLILRMLQG
jgi:hypothetical protein